MNSKHLDLEYLADVAPGVFEEIALNLDRKSIFNMMRTSKLIRGSLQKLMKSNNLNRRMNPFRDTEVVINRTYWYLGFNRLNFYGYLEQAEREGREHIVQMKKPVGKRGKASEIDKNELAQRYFQDVDYNPFFITRHLQFLNEIKVNLGTTTEIIKASGHFIPFICVLIQPKELILICPLLNQAFEQEYFEDEAFQNVQHLRIRDYSGDRFQASKTFILKPLSDSLITFEFSGSIPTYPCEQINILLKKWSNGKNPLREIKIVNGVMDENEPMLFNMLNGINNTPIDKFTQLPDFMQKTISTDLMGVQWREADISYRLLLSHSKRQMGCVYYSHSLASFTVNGQQDTSSYFGFHAFDYYPLKN